MLHRWSVGSPKDPKLAKNAPKMPKESFFGAWSKVFVSIMCGHPKYTLFWVSNVEQMAPGWPQKFLTAPTMGFYLSVTSLRLQCTGLDHVIIVIIIVIIMTIMLIRWLRPLARLIILSSQRRHHWFRWLSSSSLSSWSAGAWPDLPISQVSFLGDQRLCHTTKVLSMFCCRKKLSQTSIWPDPVSCTRPATHGRQPQPCRWLLYYIILY